MNKNTEKRQKFIKESIDKPEVAAKKLISHIHNLHESQSTGEKVKILSELLHIHPSTVWRDYIKD